MKFNVRYFPWAPGIPWKVNAHKYIVPELPPDLIYNLLSQKETIIYCHSGFLDSFYSFCLSEWIKTILPKKKIYWSGNQEFSDLTRITGLTFKSTISLDKDLLEKFPTPIFLDKNKRVYYNIVNNIYKTKSIDSKNSYVKKTSVIRLLRKNFCVDLKNEYFPKIRNLALSSKLNALVKSNKFNWKQTAIIFPFISKHSNSNFRCLNWSIQEYKALISILKSKNIKSIIINETGHNPFFGETFLNWNLDDVVFLLQKCNYVFSESPDYPLVGFSIGNFKTMTNKTNTCFALLKNSKILDKQENVFSFKKVTPIDVLEVI